MGGGTKFSFFWGGGGGGGVLNVDTKHIMKFFNGGIVESVPIVSTSQWYGSMCFRDAPEFLHCPSSIIGYKILYYRAQLALVNVILFNEQMCSTTWIFLDLVI